MHLVHLSFLSFTRMLSDDDVKEMIWSAATSEGELDHVTVHSKPGHDPVIGLFLRSSSSAEAEQAAARLWQRATSEHPELRELGLQRCGTPPLDDLDS